jgi:hypothetical protein
MQNVFAFEGMPESPEFSDDQVRKAGIQREWYPNRNNIKSYRVNKLKERTWLNDFASLFLREAGLKSREFSLQFTPLSWNISENSLQFWSDK